MTEAQILLVEDAEPDVFLVREALRRAGVTLNLRVLGDGEQATDFIDTLDADARTVCPDLVLLDLNLPKKNGNQVLERMRRSPRCMDVPVVVITSSDSPADRSQAARLGATQYFRKPSRLDEFMKLGRLVRDLLPSDIDSRTSTHNSPSRP